MAPGEAARPTVTAHSQSPTRPLQRGTDRLRFHFQRENAPQLQQKSHGGLQMGQVPWRPQQGTHAAVCVLLCYYNGIAESAVIQTCRQSFFRLLVAGSAANRRFHVWTTPTLKL